MADNLMHDRHRAKRRRERREMTWHNLVLRVGWRPIPGLRVEAAGFAHGSRLNRPAPDFIRPRVAELPNIAHFGGQASLGYSWHHAGGWALETNATIHYVGHSRLGVASPFDVADGRQVVPQRPRTIRLGADVRF